MLVYDSHMMGFNRRGKLVQSYVSQNWSLDDNFYVVAWGIDVLLNNGNPALKKYMQALFVFRVAIV